MKSNITKYPVDQEIRMANGQRIIRFISCYDDDKQYNEILGREIFLFDINDNIIWQIDAPRSFGRIYDSKTLEFTEGEYDTYFCAVYEKNGKYLAERFDGYVFELDIETGKATYLYWTK